MLLLSKCYVYAACVAVAILASPSSSVAQDDALKELKERQQQWESVEKRFAELEKKISSGEDVNKNTVEYKKLAKESLELVNRIESAAMKLLTKDRTSKPGIRALMGRMISAAQKDDDAKVLQLGDFLIGKGVNPKYFEIASKLEQLKIAQKEIFDELLVRHAEAMANDLPRVEIKTNKGTIVVELFENEAPGTVGNFVSLVETKYYDDILFHRVMESFMAQTGGFRMGPDGKQTGGKGPGYELKCECYTPERRPHFSGSLSMAHQGPRDTGGSQFYITFERTSFLDGKHTVFGRVISGMDVLDRIARTHVEDPRFRSGRPLEGVTPDKILTAKLLRKRAHVYAPLKAEKKPDQVEGSNSKQAEGPALGGPGLKPPVKKQASDDDKK